MEARKPIAYSAGPLGFSELGRIAHEKIISLLKEVGFEVRDPWKLTPREIIDSALKLPYGQEKKDGWRKVNVILGRNNAKAIEESDVIVAVLDGSDVDSGTASEIGYGSGLGKAIIGYRGDFRLSGDNEGTVVNLQVEYFIHVSGGEIVFNLDDLRTALDRFRQRFYAK